MNNSAEQAKVKPLESHSTEPEDSVLFSCKAFSLRDFPETLSQYKDRLGKFADLTRQEQVQLLRELDSQEIPVRELLMITAAPRLEKQLLKLKEDPLILCDPTFRTIEGGQKIFIIIEDPNGPGRTQQNMTAMFSQLALQPDSNVSIEALNIDHPDVAHFGLDSESSSSARVTEAEDGGGSISGNSHSTNLLVQYLVSHPESEATRKLSSDELIDLANPLNFIPPAYKWCEGIVVEPPGQSNSGCLIAKVGDEFIRPHFQSILFLAVTGIAIDYDKYANPPEDFLYRSKRVRVWDNLTGAGWIKGTITDPDGGHGCRVVEIKADNGAYYSALPDGSSFDYRDPENPDNSELLPPPVDQKYLHISDHSPIRVKIDGLTDYGHVWGISYETLRFEAFLENSGFKIYDFDSTDVEFLPTETVAVENPKIARGNIFTRIRPSGDHDVFEIMAVITDENLVLAKSILRNRDTESLLTLNIEDLIQDHRYEIFEKNWEDIKQIHPELANVHSGSHQVIFTNSAGQVECYVASSPNGLPAFLVVHPLDSYEPYEIKLSQIIDIIPIQTDK